MEERIKKKRKKGRNVSLKRKSLSEGIMCLIYMANIAKEIRLEKE